MKRRSFVGVVLGAVAGLFAPREKAVAESREWSASTDGRMRVVKHSPPTCDCPDNMPSRTVFIDQEGMWCSGCRQKMTQKIEVTEYWGKLP